jgi:hypothetical protein
MNLQPAGAKKHLGLPPEAYDVETFSRYHAIVFFRKFGVRNLELPRFSELNADTRNINPAAQVQAVVGRV